MVNPQRSGWRSEIRVCIRGLAELERSVLVISRPGAGEHPMAKYYRKAVARAMGIL